MSIRQGQLRHFPSTFTALTEPTTPVRRRLATTPEVVRGKTTSSLWCLLPEGRAAPRSTPRPASYPLQVALSTEVSGEFPRAGTGVASPPRGRAAVRAVRSMAVLPSCTLAPRGREGKHFFIFWLAHGPGYISTNQSKPCSPSTFYDMIYLL